MMTKKRSVYHVTPAKKSGGWNVKKEGNQKASSHHPKKTDAIAQGKKLAKKAPLGQIKIHKQDGTIQTEYTYKKDPYPPKG